ncbi:MAG: manganese efflux pump [Solirubrobacteraceae bacterium]|jgi:manganese efflux pump family protein
MPFKLIALVLPLGLDTFFVAAALGVRGVTARQRVRTSLSLTAFEATMPLVGLVLGRSLAGAIGTAASFAAIGVLLALAVHILVADDDHEPATAMGRGLGASIALGFSVSLDELAIGLTCGLLALPIAPVIALIALQAFIVAQMGMRVGKRIGKRVREGAERLAGAGLALLAIGLLIATLAG